MGIGSFPEGNGELAVLVGLPCYIGPEGAPWYQECCAQGPAANGLAKGLPRHGGHLSSQAESLVSSIHASAATA